MTVLTVVDERAAALQELAELAPPSSRYTRGRYLFTREPIGGLPCVDIQLVPEPDLKEWDAATPPVPIFRHRFNAIRVDDRWYGYFHDEEMGRRYARYRQSWQRLLRWFDKNVFRLP